MTGRTTRQVDEVIQALFDDYDVRVRDHHGSKQSDIRLMGLVTDRLNNEHHLVEYSLDTKNCSIKLIKQ